MVSSETNSRPLRPYQKGMVDQARSAIIEGHRRILLQSPTGSGKTVVAVEIIRLARAKNRKALFLAPRRELIYQTVEALGAHGVMAGTIMSGEMPSLMQDVQVASFDTLQARAVRGKKIRMPEADIVLVDECHLALAPTRRQIIDHYKDAIIIGFTATPARGDGKGLGSMFGHMILGESIPALTASGFLVPARYFAPSKPDLEAVGLNKDGDYIEGQLGDVMDQTALIGDIVDNWSRLASDRRTVVFCVNCAHSRHVMEAFLAQGISAEHLDGETPAGERKDILERVRRGATQVLCNVFVASYGLDIPALDCAVLARPTKNITLYFQTVGRVLRPFDGKKDALIIDHAGAVLENGFVDDYVPWSLDEKTKVKDRKAEAQKEQKSPKEIECSHCHTVFKGRRDCPSCGNQAIPFGKEIPVHQADLGEIFRDQNKANRNHTWEQKCDFIGQLRAHAKQSGFSQGWVAHKYSAYYGVWPNDPRLKMAPSRPVSGEVANWIKSQQIRWAKSKSNPDNRRAAP